MTQLYLILPAALLAPALAFLPPQNPPWKASYAMNKSTLSMACNSSGWFSPDLAAQFGIVSFDWSNNKFNWAASKPMTCQEDLVQQAQLVAAEKGAGRVFTYFNLVKALPWYSAVRELIADPAYSGFFLRYNVSKGALPFSPPCDPVTGDCSVFFHDQLQTPAVPGSPPPFKPDGVCDGYCDCGQGVPCGEYVSWATVHARCSSRRPPLTAPTPRLPHPPNQNPLTRSALGPPELQCGALACLFLARALLFRRPWRPHFWPLQ